MKQKLIKCKILKKLKNCEYRIKYRIKQVGKN